MSERPKAKRCNDWWERRTKGRMYVNARGQCRRMTAHPSGYCKAHRYGYRWNEEQERLYLENPVRPAHEYYAARSRSW